MLRLNNNFKPRQIIAPEAPQWQGRVELTLSAFRDLMVKAMSLGLPLAVSGCAVTFHPSNADTDHDLYFPCYDTVDPVTGEAGARIDDPNCDCNEEDGSVYPGAQEICDGQDNDCDAEADEGVDEDGNQLCDDESDCEDVTNECGDGVMDEATQANVENSPYTEYGNAVTDGRYTTISVGLEEGCVKTVYFDVEAFTPGAPNFPETCEDAFELNIIPVDAATNGYFSTLIALNDDGAILNFATLEGSTSEFRVRECDRTLNGQVDSQVLETAIVLEDSDLACGPEMIVDSSSSPTVITSLPTLAVRGFLHPDLQSE